MFLLLEQALEERRSGVPAGALKYPCQLRFGSASSLGFVSSLTRVSHDSLQRALSRKTARLAVKTAKSRVNYVESGEQLPGCSPSCTVGKTPAARVSSSLLLSFCLNVERHRKVNTAGDWRAGGVDARLCRGRDLT